MFFKVDGALEIRAAPGTKVIVQNLKVCCSVLPCCSVLQCAAVLQCVAVCCNLRGAWHKRDRSKCQGALQCVAVCFSVLQCVAVCCSVLQCVAVCCSVLQYSENTFRERSHIATHCNTLQHTLACPFSCCTVTRYQGKNGTELVL